MAWFVFSYEKYFWVEFTKIPSLALKINFKSNACHACTFEK